MEAYSSPWKAAELLESLTAMTKAGVLSWERDEKYLSGPEPTMRIIYKTQAERCAVHVVRNCATGEILCDMEKAEASPIRIAPTDAAPLSKLFQTISETFPLDKLYEPDIDRVIEAGKRYR